MSFDYPKTENAPKALGPYSQAVKVGNLVFVSGQVPIDPATGELVEGGAPDQAEQCLKNIRAILEAAGMTMANIVRATVYLTDLNNFGAVNEVYAGFFAGDYPARVCVEVSGLPKEALVEIDAIASI